MPETMTAPVRMPTFDYTPRTDRGRGSDEVLDGRQGYGNPALLTRYGGRRMRGEG
jgi:hypothetical protein